MYGPIAQHKKSLSRKMKTNSKAFFEYSSSELNFSRTIPDLKVHIHNIQPKYSEMHHTDKYSEHSSIIWLCWPNGSVFIYELIGSGFESSCSHSTFRLCTCFEQGVP